jgi:membrane protein
MKAADYWHLTKETAVQFWNHKGPRLGAAIAFYTALSLSPLLIVLVAMAGLIFGEAAARGEVANQIRDMVGDQGARAVQSILAEHRSTEKGVLMTVLGFATLLFGATGVFGELQGALDTIWNVRRTESGIWGTVRDRLSAFLIVCGMALLLVASLVISAILSAMSGWLPGEQAVTARLLQLANQIVSFAVAAAFFAIIFKLLPHTRNAWSDVWTGAILTAILFTLGKFLIGLYLGQAALGSAYGAAGSFVVLLVWIYYSSQMLLLGAEFTQVYANTRGTGRTRNLHQYDPSGSRDGGPHSQHQDHGSPAIGTPVASSCGNRSLGRTEP